MSCENHREALSELESKLPEDSVDLFIARSILKYLRESCLGLREPLSSTHTAAIMREHRYLGFTKKQARENAEGVRNDLIDDANDLLRMYGIKVEPQSSPK